MRQAQHLEHAVQAVLADDIADTDEVDVVCGYAYGEIPLSDLENQIELVLACYGGGSHALRSGRRVMRIDDSLADLERHVSGTPSFEYKGNTAAFHPDLCLSWSSAATSGS